MTTAALPSTVLKFEEAQETVLRYCRQVKTPEAEAAPLLAALGRVLAEPVAADRDFPPFPRSTRDGYAVRAEDVAQVPVRLRVIGQIKAGAAFNQMVLQGEAVEIMTGAAVPKGADAVVMVEYTVRNLEDAANGDTVQVQRAIAAGENVVAAGAEAHAGEIMLEPGMRIGPAQIALAAAVGKARMKVFRKPRVAVLATGDELVDVTEKPGPHQIRNSNTYSLAAQVTACGGEPILLPVAPDEERKLATLVHAGLEQADLLLLSGGVSMGQFDLVEEVLGKLGSEFFFTGALIQPGRPVVFGEIRNGDRKLPFFGLPGNPVSVMVTFDLFVRPLLEALGGAVPARLAAVKARMRSPLKTKTGLTRFLPALLQGGLHEPEVESIPWQGSGDLLASAKANCYLVVPPDREQLMAGELVSVVIR